MRPSDIAASLSARVPWRVAQKILATNDIVRGRGWDKTLEKIDGIENEADAIKVLSSALVEHYSCGEKLVRFYKVSRSNINAIMTAIQNKRIPKSDFKERYPLLLDSDELKLVPKKPTLVDISYVEDTKGTLITFASARIVLVREELSKDQLTEAPDTLDAYSEIVGLKPRYFQAMDTVWIPDKGSVIDIRVDGPKNFNVDAQIAAIGQIKDAVKNLVGHDYLDHPVNLFPLIGAIYNDPHEGNIVEAAFGTSTASHKHEKMRRSHLDLRKELYHNAGKQALASGIDLHLISVRWTRKVGVRTASLPELSLHVPVWETGAAQPTLLQGHVRNCMGNEDFEHVRGRMLHHLGL